MVFIVPLLFSISNFALDSKGVRKYLLKPYLILIMALPDLLKRYIFPLLLLPLSEMYPFQN